jgi:hypothetical protein
MEWHRQGESKYWQRRASERRLVHHVFYKDGPGIETGPPRWEAISQLRVKDKELPKEVFVKAAQIWMLCCAVGLRGLLLPFRRLTGTVRCLGYKLPWMELLSFPLPPIAFFGVRREKNKGRNRTEKQKHIKGRSVVMQRYKGRHLFKVLEEMLWYSCKGLRVPVCTIWNGIVKNAVFSPLTWR